LQSRLLASFENCRGRGLFLSYLRGSSPTRFTVVFSSAPRRTGASPSGIPPRVSRGPPLRAPAPFCAPLFRTRGGPAALPLPPPSSRGSHARALSEWLFREGRIPREALRRANVKLRRPEGPRLRSQSASTACHPIASR
jgi:hypothetical protein